MNGLGGPITVVGKSFNNQMTPVGATWTDEQIAAVLTYIRNEWGNDGGRVMPEEIGKARGKIQESGQSGAWTVETLKAAFPAE